MVFRRGAVGKDVMQLVQDLRHVMAPYSATKLKERKQNQLKDFLGVATGLKVTHFMMLSQTPLSVTLRVCRIPRGPTLSFRLINYSTVKSVLARQKNPHTMGNEFQHPPLVILNGFTGEDKHKMIMTAVFQVHLPWCFNTYMTQDDYTWRFYHFHPHTLFPLSSSLSLSHSLFLVILEYVPWD